MPSFTEKPSTSSNDVPNSATDPANPTSNASNSQTTTSEEPKQKSEAALAIERLYEERIEEEYAKREGGA